METNAQHGGTRASIPQRREQERCPRSEVLAGQRTWHMANGGSNSNGDSCGLVVVALDVAILVV